MNKRIRWVDVAKCIGMFLIYLGHTPNIGKTIYSFIFKFHVPLFFFLSGYTENYDTETSYKKYVLKNIRRIIIPWSIFCTVSLIFFCVENNPSISLIKKQIFEMLLGGCVRNTFIAISMWFLTCLFVMKILFKLLRKIKNNKIILLICLVVYSIATYLKFYDPKLPYNIDGALYYMVYYAIGYCFYKEINSYFELKKKSNKLIFYILGIISIIIGIITFINPTFLTTNSFGSVIYYGGGFIRTLILIYMILFLSRILDNITILNNTGKLSLFLCGNEYIVRRIVSILIILIWHDFAISNSVFAIFFCILVFVISSIICKYEKIIITNIKKLKVNTK